MITEEQFESTYRQLLQDLQDSYFTACRRAVAPTIELPDGRKTQVTMMIETDPHAWM
jgi:hypothetical protein